jgi:hypothetical protein
MDERIGKYYRKRGGVGLGEVIRITASSSDGHLEGVVISDNNELRRAVKSGMRGVRSTVGDKRRITEKTLHRSWEPTLKPRSGGAQ